jgi:DNA-binding LacI/PurR family transcriptional regulator
MQTTIKDIASLANVSPSTVSLALRGSEKIKSATRKKILNIAEKLDYEPCPQAVGLKARKSNLIGYLLPDINDSFFNCILKGINEVAAMNDYGLLVASVNNRLPLEKAQLDLFRRKRIDGLIISGNAGGSLPIIMDFHNRGVPIVTTMQIDALNLPLSTVVVNNFEGGKMGARHLLSLGHKTIIWATTQYVIKDRYLGFLEAIQEYPDARGFKAENLEELASLLDGPEQPTGIVCYSDMEAIKIRHFLHNRGLKVPEDISLVGFDNLKMISMPEFNFTTIAQPQEELGRVAMRLLLKSFDGEEKQNIMLPPELIVRGSTTPPSN